MNTNDITCGDIFAPGSTFAQCHASTLAALPGGRLIAAWFGGTAESNPDTAIWVGPEELLGETGMLGGHGGVNGGANLFPRLYVALYDAAVAGNRDRVAALHEVVMQISDTIYSTGRHSSSFMKGVKCALALKGICNDFMADPFHRFRDTERDRVRGYLAQVEPLVAEVVPCIDTKRK